MYTKACTCPETELTQHAEICCGKEMRAVATSSDAKQQKKQPAPA